jgi:exopolysaccharide production protein ExoZ
LTGDPQDGRRSVTWARLLKPRRAEAREEIMPGLDVLRAALAFCVMAYHLSFQFGTSASGTHGNMIIAKIGNFGVSGFFVLSGFLLLYPGRAVKPVGRFYLSRFLRLAPLFYLVVLVDVVARLGMGPPPTPGKILENLTFAFGVIHPNDALVFGGWFVGILAIFYAVHPLLNRLQAKVGWPLLVALTAGLWWWSLGSTLHGMPPTLSIGERFNAYVAASNHLWLFGLGGLLAHLRAALSWRLPAFSSLLLLAALLLLGDQLGGPFFDHFDIMSGWVRYELCLVVAAIVFVASITATSGTRVEALLCALGKFSFGLYLLHPIFLVVVSKFLGGWPGFCLAVCLTVATAYL